MSHTLSSLAPLKAKASVAVSPGSEPMSTYTGGENNKKFNLQLPFNILQSSNTVLIRVFSAYDWDFWSSRSLKSIA